MDEYTVEFRIQSADLEPSNVTATLGLQPSLVHRLGERKSEASNWEEAMWAYNGFSEAAGAVPWSSIDEGLNFLLEKLWPIRDVLEIYRRSSSLILWCGHFHSNPNTVTKLSPN